MAASVPAGTRGVASASAATTAEMISARLERMPFLPYHFRMAATLGVGTLFDAFDSLSIAAALTMIVATFHVDFKIGATLASSAFFGQFVGAFGFGFVSERIGRKWGFVIALAIFGACSVAAALAMSVNALIVARGIQGIGLGAEVPIAGALFNEVVRGNARGRFVMIYESLFIWGLILAPVMGLVLVETLGPALGWRVLFGLGGIPLIVAIIAAFTLPESPRWLAAKGRLAEADHIVSAMEAEATAAGKELAAPVPRAPVVVEKTRFAELFQGIYLHRTLLVWTQWFCTYFCSNGFAVWLPTLYMKIGGLPVRYALLLTILSQVIQLFTAWAVAGTIDRVGRVRWFAGAFAVAACAAIGGAVVTGVFHAHGWVPLLIFGLIMSAGTSVNSIGVYLYTPELYPTRMRALGTSTASSLNRLGSTIAPIAVGFLLANNLGIASVFSLFAVVMLIAFVVMQRFGIETRLRTLEEVSP
jgi:putative MFS transporter